MPDLNKIGVSTVILAKKMGLHHLWQPILRLFRKRLLYYGNKNIALHDYKTLYFPIPKVACSSLKRFCAELLGLNVTGDINEKVHKIDFPYVPKEEIMDEYKSYFRFAFVRNPWARLLSCYMNKIKAHEEKRTYKENGGIKKLQKYGKYKLGMSFEEFVKAVAEIPDSDSNSHFRSQYTYLINDRGEIMPEFIGKIENMDKDFAYISQKMGLMGKEPPHLMKSQHRDYRDYYKEETANMVRKRYQKDIELFDYEF